ncbi:uncharacterized protein LACBIDRAFT_332678 [Laccaria bicolor S238N-H82]|uniref:Predicted protein n=1 Tax=Laccaria bicolor (strain S238N-H82 / ATCC MYA-4686) TaxID=486041 RepID=B0DTI4_LACBS|nr:uncharacterized protein LACBIDRAFT_332678 [Laccaria bicolor S238N-H82]EDR02069.1 predicted protein [Laccaria bicolor S238N-H82]|eukprot:XP_001887226.1 predicted protein [Laccaria bicolor S238N-H82]
MYLFMIKDTTKTHGYHWCCTILDIVFIAPKMRNQLVFPAKFGTLERLDYNFPTTTHMNMVSLPLHPLPDATQATQTALFRVRIAMRLLERRKLTVHAVKGTSKSMDFCTGANILHPVFPNLRSSLLVMRMK